MFKLLRGDNMVTVTKFNGDYFIMVEGDEDKEDLNKQEQMIVDYAKKLQEEQLQKEISK